jgi:hypothetical protein
MTDGRYFGRLAAAAVILLATALPGASGRGLAIRVISYTGEGLLNAYQHGRRVGLESHALGIARSSSQPIQYLLIAIPEHGSLGTF